MALGGVGIAFAVGEQVPGRGEDGMYEGDDGFIGPRRAAMRRHFAARQVSLLRDADNAAVPSAAEVSVAGQDVP